MKLNHASISLAIASTLAVGVVAPEAAAQQAKPPSVEEQLRRAQPGVEHKKLALYAGSWDIEIRMGAGPRAIVYQGAAENRMTVGGRFLQIEYQAKGKAGETEGIFIVGYDARHERHTLIAMDSFGPYFVTSQGKRDAETGKIRLLGTDDDPAMKAMGYTKEFVHVLDLRGDDEFAIEVWFVDTRTPERKEFKAMDYVFKRRK